MKSLSILGMIAITCVLVILTVAAIASILLYDNLKDLADIVKIVTGLGTIVALVFAGFQLKENRESNNLAVRPVLILNKDTSGSEMEVYLQSVGNGPAKLTKIIMHHYDKEFDFKIESTPQQKTMEFVDYFALRAFFRLENGKFLLNSIFDTSWMSKEQKHTLFHFDFSHFSLDKKEEKKIIFSFAEAIDKADFTIEYEDLKGNSYSC